MKFSVLPVGNAATIVTPNKVMAFPMRGKYLATLPAPSMPSYFPVTKSVDSVVEWWWRVRAWQCDYNFGFASGSVELGRANIQAGGGLVTLEKDLCYRVNNTWGAEVDLGDPDAITFRFSILLANGFVPFIGDNFNGDSYRMSYPSCMPSMCFDMEASWNSGDDSFQYSTSTNDGANSSGVYIGGDIYDGTYNASSIPSSFSVSLTPSAYYAWANDDGTRPKWNSMTGAKLY